VGILEDLRKEETFFLKFDYLQKEPIEEKLLQEKTEGNFWEMEGKRGKWHGQPRQWSL